MLRWETSVATDLDECKQGAECICVFFARCRIVTIPEQVSSESRCFGVSTERLSARDGAEERSAPRPPLGYAPNKMSPVKRGAFENK